MIDPRSVTAVSRALLWLGVLLCGCQPQPAPIPLPPPPAAPRVDTVFITKEVAPPLAAGVATTLCLSTGLPVQVRIAANGDTLIGERRVPLRELRPGIVFEGSYAGTRDWLTRATPITFERNSYRRLGAQVALACEDLKQIGLHDGVPLFAELTAASPLETFYVPVSPGWFQMYQATLPLRR
jgi:hypothetical protein